VARAHRRRRKIAIHWQKRGSFQASSNNVRPGLIAADAGIRIPLSLKLSTPTPLKIDDRKPVLPKVAKGNGHPKAKFSLDAQSRVIRSPISACATDARGLFAGRMSQPYQF
jgi:hypothetical protein